MPNSPLVVLVGRHRLAGQLRDLRTTAGLSTTALAGKLSISQSKVSKVENAKTAIGRTEVEAWATACNAPAGEIQRLGELADRAMAEVVSNRSAIRAGLSPVQQEWATLEQTSTTIRDYAPLTIPGLLETAAYARQLYEIGKFDQAEIPTAVASRLDRQSALYDDSHRFEYVIAEAALRWRVASPAVYLGQIDRLTSLATLPTVDIRLLPLDQELPVRRWHGFILFDDRDDGGDPVGLVETMTSAITVSDPDELAQYRDIFAELHTAALAGDDALQLLSRIRSDLSATT